jgi:N-methylhydantoinase A
MAESFHREHELIYEHADREAEVQMINLRLVIVGESPKPTFPESELGEGPAAIREHIAVFLDGTASEVPLYDRGDLAPGQTFTGPAVIAQSDTTTCIPPGLSGRVDAYGNLILSLDPTD